MLGDRVEGARVFDLCAGSGAVGLEALSRGATHVTFIERDARTADLIRANAAALGADALAFRVVAEPVMRFLARAADHAGRAPTAGAAEIIFCDPPYADVPRVASALFEAAPRLLTASGRLILEHRSGEAPDLPPCLQCLDARKYGDTALLICALSSEGSEELT